MAFCRNCGNKLSDNAAFCSRCGNAVAGNSANNTAQSQKMYEEFIPALGLGKRTVFTENSLIFGTEEYAYSQLNQITLLTAATFVTNGVAQTTTESGLTLSLGYNYKDNDRFSRALTYANEQIDKAHGKTKNYKYILQSPAGSKIEVYDDYIMLYYIKSESTKGTESVNVISKGFGGTGKGFGGKLMGGLGKAIDTVGNVTTALGNTTKGGVTGNIILFSDLNIQIKADTLIINEYSIPIGQQNMDLAKEIVAYIEAELEAEKSNPKVPPIEQELWEPIKGNAQAFPLYGEILEIPQNMDIFNSYRLKFKELGQKYADRAKAQYNLKIRDFPSFVEFFPKIYTENLTPIVQRAVDILVSEGIWTVTFESLMDQQTDNFHHAIDDYNTILETANLTIQRNQEAVAGITSLVPNLVGGGFGLKGAVKGIAMAGVFNAVRDGIENSAIKNAANINPAQQAELFRRIEPDNLFCSMLVDYGGVFISLIRILIQNGQDIWYQTTQVDQQSKNIFKNLSNPNFPQDKVLGALIGLLKLNPYNPEYYEFAESHFGKSEEVARIKAYFGYDD